MVNNSLQVTTQKVPIHMVLEIQVLALDSQVWRDYINWLMGSPTDIHNNTNLQRFATTQKVHILS